MLRPAKWPRKPTTSLCCYRRSLGSSAAARNRSAGHLPREDSTRCGGDAGGVCCLVPRSRLTFAIYIPHAVDGRPRTRSCASQADSVVVLASLTYRSCLSSLCVWGRLAPCRVSSQRRAPGSLDVRVALRSRPRNELVRHRNTSS